jgi:hypothetical protein
MEVGIMGRWTSSTSLGKIRKNFPPAGASAFDPELLN